MSDYGGKRERAGCDTDRKSGHLAWCALVALALARQDGAVQSPAQENIFLTRWLATTLKQRMTTREPA